MKTIAVINQKGGVGKTTVAYNLAYSLALNCAKTLLIDLDPSANATSGLVVTEFPIQASESSCFLFAPHVNYDYLSETIVDINDNLHIIPSCIALALLQRQLVSRHHRETILSNSLKLLANHYEYILIDCCPTLGDLTINAIHAADYLILPNTYERDSLEGLSDLFKVIEEVKQNQQYKYKILRNKKDVRKLKTNKSIENILIDFLNSDIAFDTIIHQDEAINQAKINNQTVFEYTTKSRAIDDFNNLTQELIQWLNKS